jgi:hypothetical protein
MCAGQQLQREFDPLINIIVVAAALNPKIMVLNHPHASPISQGIKVDCTLTPLQ